uniref:Uncharacterized protein n=1 Tax=Avena sativa TaxID=4498 RepID=A0ACD5YGL0_AVESA
MENVVDGNGGGSGLVMTELIRIKELVKQLEVHLRDCPDLCKHLAEQIFTVTERSIGSMISSRHFDCRKRSAANAGIDSPPGTLVKANRKRKMMAKEKLQVRVSSAGGGEDDGYSWRKYGQKEILGAQHPRGYFRCTYRKTQGCSAIKQVQRADEDPAFFDVTYHGTHTCVHKTAAAVAKEPPAAPNPDARSLLQSLSSSLTVNTEGLTSGPQQGWSSTTPFSFSPAMSGLTPPVEHCPSSTQSTAVNCFGQGVSLSPSLSQLELSPTTSDSSHVPMNPFEAERRAESELQQIVSALALVGAATSMPEPPVELEDFDVSIFLV